MEKDDNSSEVPIERVGWTSAVKRGILESLELNEPSVLPPPKMPSVDLDAEADDESKKTKALVLKLASQFPLRSSFSEHRDVEKLYTIFPAHTHCQHSLYVIVSGATLIVQDRATHHVLQVLACGFHRPICIVFSDEVHGPVYAGCTDGVVLRWDPHEFHPMVQVCSNEGPCVLDIIIVGDYVVTAHTDNTIRAWSRRHNLVRTFLEPHEGVRTLTSCSRSEFFSCSVEGSIKLWDVAFKSSIKTIPQAHDGPVLLVRRTPTHVCTFGGKEKLEEKMWDAKTLELTRCIEHVDC